MIPNRGVGAAAVGDGIASVREWQALVQAHAELPEELKGRPLNLSNECT